jgi:hypothetical protein
VDANTGGDTPALTILESVRCLGCGTVYSKPAGGGTARENPGCSECGYVGWIALDDPIMKRWRPRRRAAGPLPRPTG